MAFSLFVAACGSSSGGSSSSGGKLTQIVIASDFPLTGSARDQTVSMNKAIDMKLKEVNYKVGTVPIKFTPLDDATAQAGKWDEGKCTQNMTSLATDKQVVVMIGPMNSGCAQVQVKIANTAGLAMISPAATSVGLTKAGGDPGEPDKYYPNGVRNFLRTAMADDLQGKAAAKWAKDLGKTKAFVLNDKETYGKGLANQFIMAAKKDGIDVVGDEGIDPQAANYRDLMPKITAAHADVVFFGGITQNNAGQILKDLRAADKSITFIGPDGIFEDAFLQAAGPAAEGALVTFGGVPPEKLTGAGKAFIDKYTAANGKPQAYTAYAYDAAGMAVEAIKRCDAAGAITRKCVLDELFKTTNYSGALGTFSVTTTGDTTLTQLSGLKAHNGQFVFDRTLDVKDT